LGINALMVFALTDIHASHCAIYIRY